MLSIPKLNNLDVSSKHIVRKSKKFNITDPFSNRISFFFKSNCIKFKRISLFMILSIKSSIISWIDLISSTILSTLIFNNSKSKLNYYEFFSSSLIFFSRSYISSRKGKFYPNKSKSKIFEFIHLCTIFLIILRLRENSNLFSRIF